MSEVIRLGAQPLRLDGDVAVHGKREECPYAPGVTFHLLPWAMWNLRFKRALQKRARQIVQEEGDAVSERAQEIEADGEFVAQAVVADIEGLLDGDGNPLPYSHERGVAILSDPGWAHITSWVVQTAQGIALTFDRGVDAAGNDSAPGSRGKRAGARASAKTQD